MKRRVSATAQRILTNPASEHYILVYDVHNDPRRKRLFRALSGWMQPVQRSVLEGVLTKSELGKVMATAEDIIGPNDSVKLFRQAAKVPSMVLGSAQNLVKAQLKPTKPFQNPHEPIRFMYDAVNTFPVGSRVTDGHRTGTVLAHGGRYLHVRWSDGTTRYEKPGEVQAARTNRSRARTNGKHTTLIVSTEFGSSHAVPATYLLENWRNHSTATRVIKQAMAGRGGSFETPQGMMTVRPG